MSLSGVIPSLTNSVVTGMNVSWRGTASRPTSARKIQSRPGPGETWAYVFYVELVGHATDRPIVTAVEEIKKLTKFFKVLGSYPALL